MIPTLTWTPEGVRFLDQTKLPLEESYVLATTYEQVADVIVTMVVRGAPAIGVSAAYGVALGAKQTKAKTAGGVCAGVRAHLRAPGLNPPHGRQSFLGHRPHEGAFRDPGLGRASRRNPGKTTWPKRIRCTSKTSPPARQMGAFGADLMPEDGGVLTHCNAGALASCGYGMALGVIRSAVERGKKIMVYADETRPFLQGSRLTAWELMADHIPTTVICDNMAASLMRQGRIQAVVVGADRIAANGDTANKIGTYNVAILAREHGIPFYVAAPWSSIDLATPTGDLIPIEERPAQGSDAPCRQAGDSRRRRHLQPGLRRDPGQVHRGHHHRARCAALALCGIAAGDGTGSEVTSASMQGTDAAFTAWRQLAKGLGRNVPRNGKGNHHHCKRDDPPRAYAGEHSTVARNPLTN